MGKAQLEELNKCGKYFSVPRGISMWPMILNKEGIVEIHRLDRPARRYDVVLYIRGEEQGVIHRVLHVRANDCIIAMRSRTGATGSIPICGRTSSSSAGPCCGCGTRGRAWPGRSESGGPYDGQ